MLLKLFGIVQNTWPPSWISKIVLCNTYDVTSHFVVLKAWVEKQYKLSNLVSLSAGLGQRRSINKQNGGLGYLVFGCPLTSFALRKLGLFGFIFLNK